jgi:hypothetical protein
MKSKKTLYGILALAVILLAGGLWMFLGKPALEEEVDEEGKSLVEIITTRRPLTGKKGSQVSRPTSTDRGGRGSDNAAPDRVPASLDDDEPETPAEKALKHWENVIAPFYEESEDPDDNGDDGRGGGSKTTSNTAATAPRVTLEDQLRIRDAFRELGEDDQTFEVNHAMNLLPDETVAVMYGVLFDKTQTEEIMDVIFSDILNRDEVIKNPMMREIRKDKTHPMYMESARILDVIED